MTSFTANYKRFTPTVTELLMRISASLATIQAAQILPAVADQLSLNPPFPSDPFSKMTS
ncbi:MAG: hypothetical protein QG596_158 [Actinomycetota bacterium]|jgi:hypothetical protein|nr:hypothetical protein [Actinomycetota bacterium]